MWFGVGNQIVQIHWLVWKILSATKSHFWNEAVCRPIYCCCNFIPFWIAMLANNIWQSFSYSFLCLLTTSEVVTRFSVKMIYLIGKAVVMSIWFVWCTTIRPLWRCKEYFGQGVHKWPCALCGVQKWPCEYCKADKIEEALAFWEELQRRGVMPNISNYISIINAFCKKGRISVASNLLKDALDKGLIPDVITYRVWLRHILRQEIYRRPLNFLITW